MSRIIELSSADRAIKDAIIRLNSIKANLDVRDNEIFFLNQEKGKLEENIECLKQNGVIALASEYRKIKNELVIIKAKVSLLETDRESIFRSFKEAEDALKKAKEVFEYLNRELDNNIIRFKK